MRKAMSIALVLVLALSTSAFARPVEKTRAFDKFQQMDASGVAKDFVGSGNPGVFGAAVAGTVFYGGTVWAADSARWEALQNQKWTFDTGVGSSISSGPSYVNPFKLAGLHKQMNGWVGFDNTFSLIPYFRRISSADARYGAVKCTGSLGGLGGTFSYWAGVFPAEAAALCYAGGQGYGNAWNVCIRHSFAYAGGSATLAFIYKNDTEDGFDFTHVYVDTSSTGDDVEVVAYTGVASGSASLPLTQGIELPSVPKPIIIKFCVASDGAWSDQDGLNPTVCGAFAVDNISISGAIVHNATFETTDDGWTLAPPAEGLGGDWSNLYALSSLPAPLTPCACALQDTVLAFPDNNNGHNNYQDNLAASPWIDLKQFGTVGATGKVITTNLYAELPLRNYIFVQFNAQWYPEKCLQTGKLITSSWTSNGFVYYFGGVPQCTSTAPGTLGTQIDFSGFIPAGAEQVRIAIGCLSYCRLFANCTQSSNTTPWFDYTALGVYGNPGVPFIFADGIDRGQDNFPQSGGLGATSPGRIDCNNIQGDSQPEVGTTEGDTLLITGAVGNAEVYVHFKVRPGPGTNIANFNAWYNSHAASGIDATFKRARCDTAEYGASGPLSGNWMTTYHEADPNFAAHGANDQTHDPTDITPTGGTWRLSHDIFPDNLFTAGTRIDYFYSANNVGSGVSLVDPPTAPATPYEVEILPSSFAANNTFNCTLYVDHFNRGAQTYIETGLGSVLGFGSNNVENTKWDRYDVNAESSQQGSLGRPLQTDYGATVVQILGYKNILWDSGNLNAFNLVKEDADILNPWLTLISFDNRNLYLSGDGIVFSPISESESEPSARRLVEDLAGVTIRSTCATGTYRNANCPTSGAPQDITACVNLDPVIGAVVANNPVRSVAHLAQGNGCPQLRSFDVYDLKTPDFGISRGDERYSSATKSADYASISQDAASSGTLHYRIVADGVSVHYRRDFGTACDFTLGGSTAVTQRLREVSTYFSAASENGCFDVAGSVGIPVDGRDIKTRTTLADFAPNPLISGAAGHIQFTMKGDGKATIDVFDIEGRLVKSVYNGSAKQGINDAFWNGTDESGRQVASGVFFYRLRTSLGDDLSKKMVVVSNGGK
jgi:hypothetical protein